MRASHFLPLLFLAACSGAAGAAPPVVLVAELDGMVSPVASDYIAQLLRRAEREQAACVILELDTPGGLYKSTHVICKAILASPVPFVTYVAPAGARATSAGVFITYASHVAAMHPTSSIGAATPVNLGGPVDSTMSRKMASDAVAFIRSLAERHGRNADWAEEAVRRSVSVTADSARALKVVNLVAPDIPSLIEALDGRKVRLETGEVTLALEGARIERAPMGTRLRILDYVSDPNIAYLLFTLGTLGLILELYHPGSVLPGVAGSICLILAFYGMHTLPINGAGLLLIITAIILFILEVKVTSYGVLTIGGIIAMLIGSLMLFDVDPAAPPDFPRLQSRRHPADGGLHRPLLRLRDRQGRAGPEAAAGNRAPRADRRRGSGADRDQPRTAGNGVGARRDLAGGERGADRRRRNGAGPVRIRAQADGGPRLRAGFAVR